ncbi:Candidate 1: dienelactone hydrolase [Richelia intracellularis]|nr:Candidate 1: dienelactone hydrolase [Richelia intracellularis]
MRVYLAAPKPPGQYPGILFYSDIYQLGGAMTRLVNYPSSVTLRDTQIVQELNHPET